MEIYTNAFNQACPVKSIKTPKKYIKGEPWVTNGILTSSLTKSKLLKRKLKKPTEHNINAFKKYCMIFDKLKKMAKESYFNLELELNKNNLKKIWEILRQAIHKQNKRPTIPDTFIINGKSNSNINEIAEEFNNFFGKQENKQQKTYLIPQIHFLITSTEIMQQIYLCFPPAKQKYCIRQQT